MSAATVLSIEELVTLALLAQVPGTDKGTGNWNVASFIDSEQEPFPHVGRHDVMRAALEAAFNANQPETPNSSFSDTPAGGGGEDALDRAEEAFDDVFDGFNKRAAIAAAIASTGSAPAPSAVPVAWQFKDDLTGEWRGFVNDQHRDNTIADGRWEVRALYAAPTQEQQP